MTTSRDVFEMVEAIAATSGNSQQDLIADCMDRSDLFVEVCKRALDPFVTYGVKKMLQVDSNGDKLFDHVTFNLLDELASRELTGTKALDYIRCEMELLDSESAELLGRVIQKDLRANFSAKSLNRHRPGTVFIFDCMLSHKYEEKRITKWPVAVEPKYDGVRCLAIVKDGNARFYSRTGKEFLNYGHIGKQLVAINERHNPGSGPILFDGEIMDGQFNNTVGTAHRKGEDATTAEYHVFELMGLNQFNLGNDRTYYKRRMIVDHFLGEREGQNIHPNVHATSVTYCNNHEEILAVNEAIQSAGGEGVIVKPLDGLYERKRSHAWMKVKGSVDFDLVIKDVFEGEGKFAGSLGGFVVELDGVTVKVGSGLTDDLRAAVWANPKDYIGRLAEIKGHELTPDGSIRHPVFVRWRCGDKPHEDGPGT